MSNVLKLHLVNGDEVFSIEELPELIYYFSEQIDDQQYIHPEKFTDDDKTFIDINKLIMFDFCNQFVTNLHWFLNCSPTELEISDYYDLISFLRDLLEYNAEYL